MFTLNAKGIPYCAIWCQQSVQLKGCSHLTFAFVFAFNIVSMETQIQTHRMGLNPFLMFYIEAMLNIGTLQDVLLELLEEEEGMNLVTPVVMMDPTEMRMQILKKRMTVVLRQLG